MAHEAQNRFFQAVKEVYPAHFEWVNVLEVGSLDINGSVRGLFSYPNFVGLDVGPGPAVDYAVQGQDAKYKDDSMDVTISSECFEHNPYWKETFANMVRMTRPGGLITFSCAGEGRPEHGTSRSDVGSSPLTVDVGWEYYRNLTAADFDDLTEGVMGTFFENDRDKDLYYFGIKGAEEIREIGLEGQNWFEWV